MPLKAPETKAEARKTWYGFDQHGNGYRSKEQVKDTRTNFLRQLCIDVARHDMSPSEVYGLVSEQPAALMLMMALSAMESWKELTTFAGWQLVSTCNSAQATLKAMATRNHCYLDDPKRWREICDRAAQRSKTPVAEESP